MRIALVSPRFPPYRGGVEAHVSHLSRELASRGHEVTVFTQHEASAPRAWAARGVEVRSFPIRIGKKAYPLAPGLWSALLRHGGRYDIVHAHSYHGLAALAGGFCHRRPFVFTPHYHGTGHTRLAQAFHCAYRPFGRALLARASQIVCVSNAERQRLIDDYPTVAQKTLVVPNGVALSESAVPRAWESRTNTVVYIGRLEPYKRVDVILSALHVLAADVRLVIVGTGSDKARLSAEVERLHLAGRVTFCGGLSDDALAAILADARVLVTASKHEAFGLVILEARQAGARVVASALDAHREVADLDHAGGVHLWSPDTGAGGLARTIHGALTNVDPGSLGSVLPRWPDVAAATEEVYRIAFGTATPRRLAAASGPAAPGKEGGP
jgi:glycosyltransferase involved in cell wall biosynthesis